MAARQRACSLKNVIITARRALTWCLLGLVFTAFPGRAEGADFRAQPALTVSEEYNDNIFLTTTDRTEDYITRVVPSLSFSYKSSFWNWDLSYAFDYRYYARGTTKRDSTHLADVKNRTELIKNFFFIDMTDSYARVSLDTTRDFTQESLFFNQSDRNTFTVNPNFIVKSFLNSTTRFGYRYISTWYREPAAISGYDNIGYADVTTELSSKWTLTTGVSYTQDKNDLQDFDKTDVSARSAYTYAPSSYLFIGMGQSWFHFQGSGDENQVSWDTGFKHQYSTMTVSFTTGLTYLSDPERVLRRQDRYVAEIRKDTARTSLAANAGGYQFRNAEQKHLEVTSYQLGGALSHALSPRTKILADLSVNRLKNYVADQSQTIYIQGVRLERRALENLTMALEYRYANSYSPETYLLNYYGNRALVELKMSF